MGIDFDTQVNEEIPSEDDMVHVIGDRHFQDIDDAERYLSKIEEESIVEIAVSSFIECFGEESLDIITTKISEEGEEASFEELVQSIIEESDKNLEGASPNIIMGEILTVLGHHFMNDSEISVSSTRLSEDDDI